MRKRPEAKGARLSAAIPLEAVMPAVVQSLGLDQKVGEMALLSLWPTVVGPSLLEHTWAQRVKRTDQGVELHVKVEDAATASVLALELENIRERLNSYLPQTGVRVAAIRLRIGRVTPPD